MKETRISSFSELHKAIEPYAKSNLWLFRGQANPGWQLIPKAGRLPYVGWDDSLAFDGWLRRAVEFMDLSGTDAWDSLAIAQHHGLATRLLDWSYNPLAAVFFAVSEQLDTDAVLFAYYSHWYVVREKFTPFTHKGVIRLKPRGVAQRITRQGGIFTLHGPPDLPLDKALYSDDVLEKVIIDKSYAKQLVFDLSFYGVNRLNLFPDLDGLSAHINWVTANRAYWQIAEEGENQQNSP